MSEQINMFDVEVISYPRIDNLELSLKQVEFMINSLKLYEKEIKKINNEDHEFNLFRNKEKEDVNILVNYLTDKIKGVSTRNRRIRRSAEEVGIDPFEQIGADIGE